MEGVIVVNFKGSITNTNEGVTFVCENPMSFSIPLNISYVDLEKCLCPDVPKIVEKITYRCSVPIFNGLTQYVPFVINGDDNLQQRFQIYQYHREKIPVIELYVDFKEVVSTFNHQVSTEHEENSEDDSDDDDYEEENGSSEDEIDQIDLNEPVRDYEHTSNTKHPFQATPFMNTLVNETDLSLDFPENANMGVQVANGELCVGMQFNNREIAIRAIKKYSLSKGVNYKVHESEPTTYYAKCMHFGVDCQWLVRVSLRKYKYFWEIRKYNGPHTCIGSRISQDHRKLDSDTIAECIKHMVDSDPSFKVKVVIAEIKSRYGYTITYRKAWMAKCKAIEKIYGQWEASYEALPQWCMTMCDADRASVVQLDTIEGFDKDDLAVPGVKILHRVFWSFGSCIRSFRHCKPLVQIDGTHLYGKYKGVLLVAVTQDGNQNIVPIAFAIVEGETADAWEYFLQNLRRHVVTRDEVGIISDCHESINAAIRRSNGQWEPPRAFHMYCIRHIAANFLRRFKKPYLHKLVINMGYSRTEHEFNVHYARMREHGEIYTAWLDEIPQEKWVLAFDGGYRWGHMTTNLVECMNSVLKGARSLPITMLVRTTYFRLAELFSRKGREAYARRNGGHIFSDKLLPRLQVNEDTSKNLIVSQMNREYLTFHVQQLSTKEEFRVDLRQRNCDCGNFQIDRYPCPHVIACCNSINVTWVTYVDSIYRIEEVCKVYKKEFGVVGHKSTWRQYRGERLCRNIQLRRNVKGRPKSSRKD